MTASSISFPSSRLALLLQILSVLSAYFLCFAVSLNLSSYLPLRIRTTVIDRKSTRLNSSHSQISYAVFCLNKKAQDRVGDEMRQVARHRQHEIAAVGAHGPDIGSERAPARREPLDRGRVGALRAR